MKFSVIQIKRLFLIDMAMNNFIEVEVGEAEENLMKPMQEILIFILQTPLISSEPSLIAKNLLVFPHLTFFHSTINLHILAS